jgi:DNA sulfur modification protein DndD
MKISSVTLHNFGIYAHTNTLPLDSAEPVVLIGGMNGRGKTTFLEAVLLALYGRRSFAFIESKLSFPNYLTKLVNKSDGTLNTYIDLIFYLNSSKESDQYRIKREWFLANSSPTMKTSVFLNEKYDQILSDNWDTFIEEILPNAIAPFFLFF